MNAVVLVGGQGTRLRPLTETVKKELLPLVDREILHHTLDRVTRHGVSEVVMSSPHLEDAFQPVIRARHGAPNVTWVREEQALDTGGAIVNALEHLDDTPFFALNGDILTDLDMSDMAAFHRDRGAAVTIALHHVGDARAYGLVSSQQDGKITGFREKPAEMVPGDINAGTYLIDPGALEGWRADAPVSIERDIFPRVIADGWPVYGFLSNAYWLDLGTPDRFLQATFDLLDGKLEGLSYRAPWIHRDASVDSRAHLGKHVAVGPFARVDRDAEVNRSVLLAGSMIGERSHVVGSIVGPGARVEPDASIVDSVVGEGAAVADGVALQDAGVRPFTEAT